VKPVVKWTAQAGMSVALCAVAACALLLGGCVVNQAHEVRSYRDVLDNGEAKPEPLKHGETLTLERALSLANADNEQLASQGETYLQALIAKNRAFSGFLPTLSFQPDFTLEEAPRGKAAGSAPGAPATSAAAAAATSGGFVQDGRTLRRLEAPVVGSMTFSYRDVPLYKAAQIAVAEQRQLLLDVRATILLNVAQAYYQVVISEKQDAVLEHSLNLQQARVKNLEDRFRARLALALEVSQAKADQAAARVLLDRSATDVRNGRRMLALLIGAPEVDGPLVDSTLDPDPLPTVEDSVKEALAHRQDLLAAEDALKEAHQAVDAAVAEYYPSISLNVAAYLYREDFANASRWNGILSANLPLFSGGAIHDDVRLAWSHLRQAALFESYLRREIENGVRTAHDNVTTSAVVVAELRREVLASREAYRQSVQMEANGLAIPLDVLTAQDQLLNSELQYANESFTRTVLDLDLIRAVGSLGPGTPRTLHWTAVDAAP
jgi:outer membrane protein